MPYPGWHARREREREKWIFILAETCAGDSFVADRWLSIRVTPVELAEEKGEGKRGRGESVSIKREGEVAGGGEGEEGQVEKRNNRWDTR